MTYISFMLISEVTCLENMSCLPGKTFYIPDCFHTLVSVIWRILLCGLLKMATAYDSRGWGTCLKKKREHDKSKNLRRGRENT